MTGLSQGAYARHRGVSRPAVKKAIDTGRIKKAVLPDGTIDATLADQLWAENTNPEKQANGWKKAKSTNAPSDQPVPAPDKAKKAPAARPLASASPIVNANHAAEEKGVPDGEMDFNKARTSREIFAAKIVELDFRERSKELVKIEDVRIGIFNALTILRTHVMGIHSKCRMQMQADLPPHIVALIETLCRDGLEDAAKSLQELADGKL